MAKSDSQLVFLEKGKIFKFARVFMAKSDFLLGFLIWKVEFLLVFNFGRLKILCLTVPLEIGQALAHCILHSTSKEKSN